MSLVEADGARSMSVKAPAEHEPVIPDTSTLVIVVAAIDAVGRPIRGGRPSPEPRRGARRAPANTMSSRSPNLASILLHTDGGLKGIPETARVAVVITRVTPQTTRSRPLNLAELLLAHPRVDRTITLQVAGN